MSHRMKAGPPLMNLSDRIIGKLQDKITCYSGHARKICGARINRYNFRCIKLSCRADAKIIFECCNAHCEHSCELINQSRKIEKA